MIICSCVTVKFNFKKCSHYVTKGREVTQCKRRGKHKIGKKLFYCDFHNEQFKQGRLTTLHTESSDELSGVVAPKHVHLRKSFDAEATSSQGSTN